jgi:hypothetical protein
MFCISIFICVHFQKQVFSQNAIYFIEMTKSQKTRIFEAHRTFKKSLFVDLNRSGNLEPILGLVKDNKITFSCGSSFIPIKGNEPLFRKCFNIKMVRKVLAKGSVTYFENSVDYQDAISSTNELRISFHKNGNGWELREFYISQIEDEPGK